MFNRSMVNARNERKAINIHKMKDGDVLVQIEIFKPHYEELTFVVRASACGEACAEFTHGIEQ